MDDRLNDNDARAARRAFPEPDAHGQAAFLLAESLIHGLLARSVLTVADAVEIIQTAADVKAEVAVSLGESEATMRRSLALLDAVADSLKHDLG